MPLYYRFTCQFKNLAGMTGENQWIQQTTKECQDLFLHYEILQASKGEYFSKFSYDNTLMNFNEKFHYINLSNNNRSININSKN